MEAQNTTVVSNTTFDKNGTPGHDYPQQPAPTTYYNGNSGQPPYYQPHQAPAGYYPAQNNAMNSSTVVVTQPSPQFTQVVPVQDNMGLAIFTCLCCFWPLGLVAILKANEAKDAIARGDLESARRNGSAARKFSFISIGIGLASVVITVIVVVVVILVLSNQAQTVRTSNGYSYSNNGYNR